MYELYTDGATSKNGYEGAVGGAAFVMLINGEKVAEWSMKVEPATNNICEMLAVIHACEEVSTMMNRFDSAIIYSDSAYIINCYKQFWWKAWLHNNWVNSKKEPVKNKELWEKLIQYFTDPRFQFKKVKGHAGNEWNEYVDKLAVAAKGM